MKTEPAPKVEGKTQWKRLDNAVRHIFTVSKEDVLKAEAQQNNPAKRSDPKRKAIA